MYIEPHLKRVYKHGFENSISGRETLMDMTDSPRPAIRSKFDEPLKPLEGDSKTQ